MIVDRSETGIHMAHHPSSAANQPLDDRAQHAGNESSPDASSRDSLGDQCAFSLDMLGLQRPVLTSLRGVDLTHDIENQVLCTSINYRV
jgi:hypothetical protein